MKRPRINTDHLIIPQAIAWAEEVGKAVTPVDEATTSVALNPLIPKLLLNDQTGPAIALGMLARTSILFLIDADDFSHALESAADAPRLPELPPLPFPRIAVEAMQDTTWPMGDENGEHILDLEAFLISEVLQGEQWLVTLLIRKAGGIGQQQYIAFYSMKSDGSVSELRTENAPGLDDLALLLEGGFENLPSEEEIRSTWHEVEHNADDPRTKLMCAVPLECAHLINARGVTLDEHGVGRAERRRYQRKGWTFPKTYLVYIEADARATVERGRSDRTYSCRWLVRGHWRRYPNHKTWIRPYIKGPAGAPWRGRPIYVAPREEVAT